ncbi:MAG: efflux transporter outer membrane subunit [Herbaspirillum sp.]|uniref:efflux transporter outer membrane subunit n=1 Tax=Herbaspirillum sp. TaxID=1890675 RepID=UPI0025831630|nr:efflux transporter outer membrane subunit [Herbaspirillum sp.]MCP3656088.1 efflux transporter outer membrane subunit [Herbaspirillum sp.]MCP3948275.1 efflux transporter outer membrane subunit [Herbaspirillum sp.]MCP4030916.1 efflux transporter outer membrane subunit [Herbaspirillum sp.]MCP4557753.1 efflux transporter outer membrane subunit [Herbaspirillum sp.]
MKLIQHLGGASVLMATLLAGCSLAPTYERPDLPVQTQWPDKVAPGASDAVAATPAASLPWQEFFRDASLRRLITLALEHNRDLRVAALNIERARALYQVQSADRLPTVNLGVSGARQQTPNEVAPAGKGGLTTAYNVGLGVTAFELDLFGRVRNLSGAALERFNATEEARKTTQISVVAQVAYSYEALVADERLLALARQTLESRTASHQRQVSLRDMGASSDYDLHQSDSLLEAVRIAVLQAQRQRAVDENALVLLLGQPVPAGLLPGPDASWSSSVMAELPAGLPSDLLTARPDIAQQEALLRAANANIGVARAAFFPRISLTGGFGSASDALNGLFESGSRSWSFLPSITLPIFDGGRNRANLGVAQADRDIAIAQYEKTIQGAFREVADALAGRATLGDELRAVQAQERAEQKRHDLAKLRYDSGEASYLDYLDAQRAWFASQQQSIRTGLAEVQNRISLYKALGGGWKDPAPSAAEQLARKD